MARTNNKPILGYLYIAWLGIVCIVLMIVNFNLVTMGLAALPRLSADPRVSQIVQFFVPTIMIFVEFYIYDLLVDRADRANDA